VFGAVEAIAPDADLFPVPDPTPYGLVELGEGGRVLGFIEKPDPAHVTTNTINAGIYLLERTLLARIPEGRPSSMEREFFPGLLADRSLKAGAIVLGHNGKPFTAASIGGAIATRAIMADLRVGANGITGGPAPFAKADRSRFLQALDEALVRLSAGR